MFISEAFAQAASPVGGAAGFEQFLPLVLIFVVFYFLLLRPQQRKMKQHKEMVAALRRGDRVVTQGGLIGKVSKVVSDTEVLVEFGEGAQVLAIRTARSAISEILNKTEPVAAKDGEAKAEGDNASAAPAEKNSSVLGKLFGKK